MAQTPDVKITVVGNARVGKTALLMAYTVRKPTLIVDGPCATGLCARLCLCAFFSSKG